MDLADLDQYRFDGGCGAVVVVGGELRVYFGHWKNSPASPDYAQRHLSEAFGSVLYCSS